MKKAIFISYSGDRSKAMAGAIQEYLKAVFPRLTVMQWTDEAPGSGWLEQLKEFLRKAGMGILCMTNENQKSPWLHYEYGFLDSDRSAIIPLFLDPPLTDRPLGGLHGLTADRKGISELVRNIEQRLRVTAVYPDEDPQGHELKEHLLSNLESIRSSPPPPEGIHQLRDFERRIQERQNNSPVLDSIVKTIVARLDNRRKAAFPMFISGSAAVGKSTSAKQLRQRIQICPDIPGQAAILPTDAYCLSRQEKDASGLQGYERESHRLDDLAADARALVEERKRIRMKPYDHATGHHGKEEPVEPEDIIIIEGVYAFYVAAILGEEGLRVLLDAKKPKAKELKFAADVMDRNKTVEEAFHSMDVNYDSYEKEILEVYGKLKDVLKVYVTGYWSYSFG